MRIRVSTVEDALRAEDIETLVQHGAPDDEYTPDVHRIMSGLDPLSEDELTGERLVAIVRSVWSHSFGPLGDEDLEMRTPAFRQVTHRIIAESNLP